MLGGYRGRRNKIDRKLYGKEPQIERVDPRQRYNIEEKIGRGGYGFVYKAKDTISGDTVAAKVINLEEAGDEMDEAQQEITVMSFCNCPQLTKYYASYVVGRY